MKNREKLSQEIIAKQEFSYFATKHAGGLKSTIELIELCNINKDSYVLDAGCGVGTTACYLAKKYGCRVIGIDILERMIKWSKQKAKKEGLEDRVEFRIANAQNLPFEDALFDVVIGEAVNAFVEDKQKAMREYVRVTKPGGFVGLHEATWLKTSPPKEVLESFAKLHKLLYDVGLEGYGKWVNEFSADGWKNLLQSAGLKDIVVRTYKTNPKNDIIDRIKLIGPWRILKTYFIYFTNPEYRALTKKVVLPKIATEYYGYGTYVGKKY